MPYLHITRFLSTVMIVYAPITQNEFHWLICDSDCHGLHIFIPSKYKMLLNPTYLHRYKQLMGNRRNIHNTKDNAVCVRIWHLKTYMASASNSMLWIPCNLLVSCLFSLYDGLRLYAPCYLPLATHTQKDSMFLCIPYVSKSYRIFVYYGGCYMPHPYAFES